MNTVRSTWLGWGFLVVAGGGSYYFAKKSINADRQARHEADMRRKRVTESLERNASSAQSRRNEYQKGADHAGSPSGEAGQDPAPSSHGPEGGAAPAKAKSKFEPSEPYRTKKGDRFS